MENLEYYRNGFDFFVIVDNTYEGELILGSGVHGDVEFKYLSHIQWNEEPENSEKIETHIDNNLFAILASASQI